MTTQNTEGIAEPARPEAAATNPSRIWLRSYPPGVPPEVRTDRFATLGELFRDSVTRYGERPAFVSMGRVHRFRDVDARALAFGAWLQQVEHLPQGSRVAIVLPNLLQYPVSLFGALLAGYVVVNCNPLYTESELARQLRDSEARVVVTLANRADLVRKACVGTSVERVIVTGAGDLLRAPRGALINLMMRPWQRRAQADHLPPVTAFRRVLREGGQRTLEPFAGGSGDLAFLQYTGGTTGIPKGAMLTHGNILANIEQCLAWLKPYFSESQPETVLTALPLYHIFALTVNCLVFFRIGARNVLIADPRRTDDIVNQMRRYRVTALTGVSTLFNALLHNPRFPKLDFRSLRFCLGGGMAVQRAVAEKWHTVTGKPIIEAYGLSETSPAVTANRLDLATYSGTIGLPLPSTEIAIRDDAGRDLPLGEVGELCVRGPQVMRGYWKRPDETARSMTPDGYFRTGDLARLDDSGMISIVDRKKDMIISGGFNIYPNEIEEVAMMHPGVLEAGAVGVPDPAAGERLKIVVVRKDLSLTEEALVLHCRRYLTGYKVPRQVAFADALPKNPVGKVLRRELRSIE